MQTHCNAKAMRFQALGKREVIGNFDGGTITSDAGGLLLREVEARTGILERFAGCFTDYRRPELTDHSVRELIAQRVYAIALGYEDLNDHDELRRDPLLAVLAGKDDPTGQQRSRKADAGKALAGKSTLNRLELTPAEADEQSRYKKIVMNEEAVDRMLVDVFLESHAEVPNEIVIDVDATDDPLYGHQEGRFFHGYYRSYCYLPLYMFCGEQLLCARLRSSNIDAAAGCVEEVSRIVEQIRQRWPQVRIILRGDSGFCREEMMRWCEGHGVEYVFGLAKNARLIAFIEGELKQAKVRFEQTGENAREFKGFVYQTLKSWSRARRVIGKAEYLSKGANPRFIVTSLPVEQWKAQALYEEFYCARGDMENRIKEQQLYLFADRTSSTRMRTNQLRLWFSSVAYLLLQALRRVGLAGTSWAKAQCRTIRLKLLKIGAQIRVTVRKVWISLAEGYPYGDLFAGVLENIQRGVPLRC